MASAESLNKDLVYLMLQFLGEEKFQETRHMLERESGVFLDINHLQEMVLDGKLEETEKYLSGFTGITDNALSVKMFFEIRKQKYLEALDRKDRNGAVHILANELKVFSTYNENLYKEIAQLITMENFRQTPMLSNHPNAQVARVMLFAKLREMIMSSPLLKPKLEFPVIRNSRLRALINQSLNWQHLSCGNSRLNPTIITLFRDHICPSFDNLRAHMALRSSNYVTGNLFPNHPTAAALASTSAMLSERNRASCSTNLALGVRGPGGSKAPTRSLPNSSKIMLPRKNIDLANNASNELPKILVQTLNQGSTTTTMDFHPWRKTILAVGTIQGDITIWDVSNGQKLVTRGFQIWNISATSETLKGALAGDSTVVVKRVLWCNDYLLGVAYSKNIVQLFNYIGRDNIQNFLEIEAHNGSVNDLAFSKSNGKPCLITCGDDKTVKIWEVASGIRLYSFGGHEAPVLSVCTKNLQENICFVLSTSVNGKINAWNVTGGSTRDFNAPGRSSAKMAYSDDATRLFSGGTNSERESHIVEWNESDLTVKKTYQGLQNYSLDLLQFDTTNNKFLACGDAFSVKFWDMSVPELMADTYADGELAARPLVRFNADGSLLAVTATQFKIKILSTRGGLHLMRNADPRVASQVAPSSSSGNQDRGMEGGRPSMDELARLCEINAPNRVRPLRIPRPPRFSEKKA